MKKLHYGVGDIFAFPLKVGNFFCVGIIAGMPKGGKILLGYFYANLYSSIPSQDQLQDLKPGDAIRIWRFGDLSLFNREWPVVGRVANFDRQQWPSAKFLRESMRQLITYSNDDPQIEIQVEPYVPDGSDYEKDGVKGSELVETAMTKIVGLAEA